MNTTQKAEKIFAEGHAAHQRGDVGRAAAAYQQVLEISPTHADALHLLGVIALSQSRLPLAEELITRSLTHRPHLLPALANLGLLYRRTGRHDEALAVYQRGLQVQDNHLSLLLGMAEALHDKNTFEEAHVYFVKAAQHHAHDAGAWHGVARNALRLGLIEDADNANAKALHSNPAHRLYRNTQGLILQNKKQFSDAKNIFESLHAEDPDNPQWLINLGLLELSLGDYARGFAHYDARHNLAAIFPHMPVWRGEDLSRATLLVHGEQGLGDCLLFARFLPHVAARAQKVIITADPTLIPLLRRSFPHLHVASRLEALPAADVQTVLLSLPHHLGVSEPAQTITPYLVANPVMQAAWAEKLGKFPKPWVGVAWAGNPDHVTDYQRSVGMHRLLSTLQPFVGAGTFFSLQKNADEDALQKNYPFVISLAPHLNSYDDTAALLTQLNTLVCSDTSLVHAAGALGVPCHVLLHHDPFWVFGTAGDKTPWYPTLTLHRQPSPRDWAGCLQSLIKKLF